MSVFFSGYLNSDSFYCYVFKFTNLFFCNMSSAINQTQCIFHYILISRSLSFLISSMSLLNFLDIQTIIITVVSLPANSNICFKFKSVLMDISPHYKLCFSPFCIPSNP